MEQETLPYSTKNIPVPNQNKYRQLLISKAEKVYQNMRWKAFFYLNPEKKPKAKNNFNFKSTAPPPHTRDQCYYLSQKERRSPLGIENGGRVLNIMDINQLYICSPEDCLQEFVNMKL